VRASYEALKNNKSEAEEELFLNSSSGGGGTKDKKLHRWMKKQPVL